MRKLFRWTDENIEFLTSIYHGRTRQESTNLFNDKFGTAVSVRSVGEQMRRRGIRNGMQGYASRFSNGQKAWNKGIEHRPHGSEKGWFKKGEMSKKVVPVGHERWEQGWVWMKIAMPSEWVLKHRYLYEQHHNVKLEKNQVVLFKDEDRSNFDIDNLFMTDLSVSRSVSVQGLKKDDPQLNYLMHKVVEVEIKTKRMEKKQKEGAI